MGGESYPCTPYTRRIQASSRKDYGGLILFYYITLYFGGVGGRGVLQNLLQFPLGGGRGGSSCPPLLPTGWEYLVENCELSHMYLYRPDSERTAIWMCLYTHSYIYVFTSHKPIQYSPFWSWISDHWSDKYSEFLCTSWWRKLSAVAYTVHVLKLVYTLLALEVVYHLA